MKLRICEISYAYPEKEVLHNLNMNVDAGEVVGLLGPNGSGKTTFLKCIAHLYRPSRGKIYLGDKELQQFKKKELSRLVAYVPQDTTSLFPMSVLNSVLLGRTPYVRFAPTQKDMDIALASIKALGLQNLSFHKINALSGGERQCVFIARALAQEPRILLLDEPTSSLDLKHQLETLQLVRRIARELQLMVIISIHDLNLAARFVDIMLLMKEGQISAQGSPHQVMTQENIRNVYGIEATVREENDYPFIIPTKVQL